MPKYLIKLNVIWFKKKQIQSMQTFKYFFIQKLSISVTRVNMKKNKIYY